MRTQNVIPLTLLLVIILTGCAEVGPQEGGVRTNFIGISKGFGDAGWFKKGIAGNPLAPGLYFNVPHLSRIDKYQINEMQYHMRKDNETGRDDVSFKTKDGQKAWIDVSIRYRLLFDELPTLHREYGDSFLQNVIRPTVRSLVNNKLGEYSAEEIYDGQTRQRVSTEIRDLINNGYEGQRGTRAMGLEIVEVLFRRFEFTDDYQAAIEEKRIASEQHKAAIEWAKKKEAEATGEKMAMIQRAEGEAETVKLNAEAALYSKMKEAEGVQAMGEAQARAQGALVEAMGGGEYVVQLEFAKKLSDSFQVWGIPTGDSSNSVMDISGIFGNMFPKSASVSPGK